MYEDVLKEPQFANSVKVEVRSTVLAVREIDTIGMIIRRSCPIN